MADPHSAGDSGVFPCDADQVSGRVPTVPLSALTDPEIGGDTLKRFVIALAAAALVAGSATGLASPAFAAGTLTLGDGTVEATLEAGESVLFCASSVAPDGCTASGSDQDPATALYLGTTTGTTTYGEGSTVTVTATRGSGPLPAGVYTVVIRGAGVDPVTSLLNVVIGNIAPADGSDGTPPPVYQGLPLPGSGSCADVKDADYAWGTGLTGGWQKAWEPWVNEGKGGWACVRTMAYAGGEWVINNSM